MKYSVGIVGCGLIGGSLALRLSQSGVDVVVWDISDQTRLLCTDAGLDVAPSLEECIRDADIVVLATPPDALITTGLDVLQYVSSGCVVTDVGSVKHAVSANLTRAYGERSRQFIPGHPMAGKPAVGFPNATPDLFDGCTWVLCASSERIAELARHAGAAHVVIRDPREHDHQVAMISHVPQLAVSAVAASLSPDEWQIVHESDVLREAMRLSMSPYGLWRGIVSANEPAIRDGLAMLSLFSDTQESCTGEVDAVVAAMSTGLVSVTRDAEALELAGPGFRSATHALDAAIPDFARLTQALAPLDDLGNLQYVFAKAHEGFQHASMR